MFPVIDGRPLGGLVVPAVDLAAALDDGLTVGVARFPSETDGLGRWAAAANFDGAAELVGETTEGRGAAEEAVAGVGFALLCTLVFAPAEVAGFVGTTDALRLGTVADDEMREAGMGALEGGMADGVLLDFLSCGAEVEAGLAVALEATDGLGAAFIAPAPNVPELRTCFPCQ